MKLWRISNYADLKGIGGIKTSGLWHNKGIPVVYLAESPALAMLEVLVNFDLAPDEVPENYQLLEVEYSSRKGISRLNSDTLTEDWQEDSMLTKSIGDEWLSGLKGALLRVPSAVVPHSFNYLFNPRHEQAQHAKITTAQSHPYDRRLW